ncbi:MAG: hypothetical protein A2027_00720 [Thermodesulfovibrio sp. RBG_19FT_COMBO_41_18]|nr:MAG: hypothetical protein A2027_00720 [Thermodesulfovibrio sp. RBG_19FT_COMBO_41_18]
MKIVGYVRVSSDKQADAGMSLEVQESQIIKYAELYDIGLGEIIVDAGESAKSLKRPGMLRLIELMDSNLCQGVLIVKLDRLTRSVKDLCYLLERYFSKDKVLISVQEKIDTNSAMGRMVMNVVMSISQWEREATSERTKAVLQHKKTKGERIGNIPFGYKLAADGIHLEEDLSEQRVIDFIKTQRSTGKTLAEISVDLANEQLYSRYYKPFNLSQISKMARM